MSSSTTDYLLPGGSLSRVLTLGTGETYTFPDDSLVIITRDGRKVYDWYGRRIQLGEDIDSVIRHYGSFYNGPDPAHASETFIVRKKNGKLAIAKLSFIKREPEYADQFPTFKQIFVGTQLYRTPKISLTDEWEFDRIDHAIIETPTMQAFFAKCSRHSKEKQWDQFIDINKKGDKEDVPITFIRSNTLSGLDMPIGSRLKHLVVANRSTIFNTPKDKEPRICEEHIYLLGDIVASENGHKLIATTPSNRRIATDAKTIEYIMARPFPPLDLYWYYTD